MTFKQATTAAIILAVTIAMTSILGVANAHNHEGEKPAMTGINVAALTLPEITRGLEAGQFNSQDLTRAYLNRIDTIDRAGPTLNAVIAVNSSAMTLAKKSDMRRAKGEALSPLDGVPFLLKDNIESKDRMPTTAGSTALVDNMTRRDSPLVARLRASGAIILGKTNLSQWANFRSSHSVSGWSAVGGLVKNPHVLDRQACGSSSGSAAATAASLASGSVGTETNGSIICPSQVNGVVGLKPTQGLLPIDHIVPISATQDTAGPITKSVAGAALMLDGMTGWENDYFGSLDADVIDGMRIGVMEFSRSDNPRLNAQFDAAMSRLEAAGATLVRIGSFDRPADFWGASRLVLNVEFKEYINQYLSSSPANIPVRSLSELIAFNNENAEVEQAVFGQDIFENSLAAPGIESEEYQTALMLVRKATRDEGIDALLSEYDVKVLVGPSGPISSRVDVANGDVWPPWAGAGSMAAVSGYPNLTVPMGTIAGIPVGISFMSGQGSDSLVLSVGVAFEQTGSGSPAPGYQSTVDLDVMSRL